MPSAAAILRLVRSAWRASSRSIAAAVRDWGIPQSRTEAAIDRLEALDADVTSGSFPGGHGIGPQELDAVVDFVASRTA